MRKKHFSESALIFWSVFRLVFEKSLFFSKTKKNRSEIASSFPAVARLDLSHVSENKGFGNTNLYVIKTKFICCRDKKLGARAERARRGFFSPKKRHSYFLITQYICFVLEKDKIGRATTAAAATEEESPGRVQPPSHHAQGFNIPFGHTPHSDHRPPPKGDRSEGYVN